MKKILLRIGQVAFIAIISFLLIIQIFQRVAPNSNGFFGFRTFVIVSDSMKPKLSIGDVILVQKTKPKNIKINDVITYQGESNEFKNKVITHQVKNIMEENQEFIFYTKGLANDRLDPAVYEEQVYGVMKYKFLILSIISKIIRNPIGFTLLVVIPLILLFVSEVKSIRKEINERR